MRAFPIQVVEYEGGTAKTSTTLTELSRIASAMSGSEAEEVVNASLAKAASLVGDSSFGTSKVVVDPPGFTMSVSTQWEGIGSVRGSSIGLLGRSNLALLHFYAMEEDWPTHASFLTEFVSGFQRTPEQRVVVVPDNSSSRRTRRAGDYDWSRVQANAIVGGVLGLLATALGARRAKRAGRSTDPPQRG